MSEAIYAGTWFSGPPPAELVDFEIMREMHWSWSDLQSSPDYVKRFTWDLMQARRKAEAEAAQH